MKKQPPKIKLLGTSRARQGIKKGEVFAYPIFPINAGINLGIGKKHGSICFAGEETDRTEGKNVFVPIQIVSNGLDSARSQNIS